MTTRVFDRPHAGTVPSVNNAVNPATWARVRAGLACSMNTQCDIDGDSHGKSCIEGYDLASFTSDLQHFASLGASRFVVEWFFDGLAQQLRCHLAPQFWQHLGTLPRTDASNDSNNTNHGNSKSTSTRQADFTVPPVQVEVAFLRAFGTILLALQPRFQGLESVDAFLDLLRQTLGVPSLRRRWQCMVSTALFTNAPDYVHLALRKLFDYKFDQFHALYHLRHKTKSGDDDDNDDNDDSASASSCGDVAMADPTEAWGDVSDVYRECLLPCRGNRSHSAADRDVLPGWAGSEQFSEFHAICVELSRTGILALSGRMVASRLYAKIQEHIDKTCTGNFERCYLSELEEWLNAAVLPWLKLIFSTNDNDDAGAGLYTQWSSRLHFHVHEVLGRLRIQETFNIIIDLPDSMPAVEDLKACLEVTRHYQELIRSFRRSLEQRLLHPGANTADIITQYVSTIKALRTLDPSGAILDVVGAPIREYLRSRSDTIRCIVSALTEDEDSDLFGQLGDQETNLDDEGFESDGDITEDWTPAPIEYDAGAGSSTGVAGSRRASDIISMLVNIYGSKDLFVNEYRLMLAEKLMASLDFETDREVRTLELLKLRFGEASLHNCEIMVRDIDDSKRINSNIKGRMAEHAVIQNGVLAGAEFDTKIVSRLFWPTIPEEEVQLPGAIQQYYDAFNQYYKEVKAPRELVFYKQLGHVTLELEFESCTLPFTVTTAQAAVIHHFSEREEWSAGDLARALGIAVDKVGSKVSFWANRDIITQERRKGSGEVVYKLNPDPRPVDAAGGPVPEAEAETFSSEAQGEQEMKVYETFIIGMLTNFENAPLDRLHNMLKMVVQDPPYDITEDQLAEFLQRLVKQGTLSMAGRNYKLNR